jgi:aminotransferase in exopolysaccharide biosynthesis
MSATTSEFIPLSVPHLGGNEWKYVKECLDTGWVSSVGAYVNEFERRTAAWAGAAHAVATVNGTSALHIALRLAGVRAGDYVLLPNLTFVASANSIAYTGAAPILIDADVEHWQMDLDLLEAFLRGETRFSDEGIVLKEDGRRISAIMPVHVLGNMCDMDRLMALARQYGLAVVEDATEALGSWYGDRHAGTFGQMGCFSYNGNKIITTGGGGMIITDNEDLARRAKHLTTQAKSDPMEYFHDEIGYNYRLVNLLAALGVAQMEQLPEFIERRRQNALLYREHLSTAEGIRFQKHLPSVRPNEWLFTLLSDRQKELLAGLQQRNIQARPFWVPMNRLPMYAGHRYVQEKDVSGRVLYAQGLSLPSSSSLSDDQVIWVCEQIKSILQHG